MSRYHAPSLIAARPHARVPKVSGDGLSVHENTQPCLKRHDSHIGGDAPPLQITGLVQREANGAGPMEREIIGFRYKRAVGADKEQRIIDQAIEGFYVAVELRLPQRRFQLFNQCLMHDDWDVVNRSTVRRADGRIREVERGDETIRIV